MSGSDLRVQSEQKFIYGLIAESHGGGTPSFITTDPCTTKAQGMSKECGLVSESGFASQELVDRVTRVLRFTSDPQKRMDKFRALLDETFSEMGMPPPEWAQGSDEIPSTAAFFDSETWSLVIAPDYLDELADEADEDALSRFFSSVWHEARHAEIAFKMAQRVAAKGKAISKITYMLGLREDIAKLALQRPLRGGPDARAVDYILEHQERPQKWVPYAYAEVQMARISRKQDALQDNCDEKKIGCTTLEQRESLLELRHDHFYDIYSSSPHEADGFATEKRFFEALTGETWEPE